MKSLFAVAALATTIAAVAPAHAQTLSNEPRTIGNQDCTTKIVKNPRSNPHAAIVCR